MSAGETIVVTAQIVLTSDSEITLDNEELAELIASQMSGELDDEGLACLAVSVTDRSGNV